jgi:hypothetical protein
MRFRDGSDKWTASNLVHISEKVRRRPWQWLDKLSGKKPWAVLGKSHRWKVQTRSIDIKVIVHKEFVLAGQTVPHTTVTFYGDCEKMCEDFVPNFGDKKPAVASRQCTTWHFPLSPGNFFTRNHMTDLPHPPYFSLFPRLKVKLKASILTQLSWSRQNRRQCSTPSQNSPWRIHLKMAEALGTVHMREMALLRWGWRPVDPKLVFDQITEPVPEIIDTTSYIRLNLIPLLRYFFEHFLFHQKIHVLPFNVKRKDS